jgi:transposase-like protein
MAEEHKKPRGRRKFSEEFKRDAVKLVHATTALAKST